MKKRTTPHRKETATNNKQDCDVGGHIYEGTTLVRPWELKAINFLTPRVPISVSTYHLTISSIFFSAIMIGLSFLARNNILWMLPIIMVNITQFFADALDGEVGRTRNSGLVWWGFYVDHFLDYVFAASLCIVHMIIWPADTMWFVSLMAVLGAFFFHEALSAICFGKYNVRGYNKIGGTELRIVILVLDFYAMVLNVQSLKWPVIFLTLILGQALVRQFLEKQRILWNRDLKNKADEEKKQIIRKRKNLVH